MRLLNFNTVSDCSKYKKYIRLIFRRKAVSLPKIVMDSMAQIIFIGAGNLATHLSQALQAAGHQILQIYSRTQQSAFQLIQRLDLTDEAAITSLTNLRIDADIYIYALRDEVLAEVVSQVHVSRDALHLHTSGSMSISVFGEDKPNAGVFYPFQTFSKEKAVDFQKIPILLESSTKSIESRLITLAQDISSMVYPADENARKQLHIAGVFACNFVNCLYGIAEEQLAGTDLPFEVLLPLIDETAAKVHTLSPREAQTGPAIRRDEKVMQAHVKRLKTVEEQTIYQLLSKNIIAHEK